jgi:hypothetical protein
MEATLAVLNRLVDEGVIERYGLQAYWQGFLRRYPEAET